MTLGTRNAVHSLPEGLESLLRARIRDFFEACNFETISEPADALLTALEEFDSKELLELATVTDYEGTKGLLKEVQKRQPQRTSPYFAQISNLFGSSSTSPNSPTSPNPSTSAQYASGEEDIKNPDIVFIQTCLRMWRDAVEDNYASRENTERDGDVTFMTSLFKVYRGLYDCHFGEAISRPSRERRKASVDATSIPKVIIWIGFSPLDASMILPHLVGARSSRPVIRPWHINAVGNDSLGVFVHGFMESTDNQMNARLGRKVDSPWALRGFVDYVGEPNYSALAVYQMAIAHAQKQLVAEGERLKWNPARSVPDTRKAEVSIQETLRSLCSKSPPKPLKDNPPLTRL
ncbi:hypothetical protein DFS34DRAFT_654730 [Phlyctochytrium arcticum]|nr:hypothetical protein DFS34DRAFT_654730 [Phlyctochytrium arcticum]